METINKIELRDESVYPDEQLLKSILGRSYDAYCELLKLYDDNEMEIEWRYYKDGKAWLCKVQIKKRTIVWMSAWKGYMQATIYFPEKYIEEIYTLADAALRHGQPFFRVHIFPFKMSNENMEKHKGSEWHPFWSNLKEGYISFENNGNIPPNVEVKKGRYVFSEAPPTEREASGSPLKGGSR